MISADQVKQLRDKTGAGMMDCKRALTEANGDMEQAIEVLRKSGVAKAEKKSARTTNEGKVACVVAGDGAAIVEILCETDFAAKSDRFLAFVDEVVNTTAKFDADGDATAMLQEKMADELVNKIAIIGENMQLRRAARWARTGKIASYIHGGGRIGVMVEVEGENPDDDFMSDLCMHIAAFKPDYICSACIPAEKIAKEKEIAAAADPKLAGKPAEMIEKILAGKINKWFSEVTLLQQPWIRDDKSCLAKLRPNLKVKRFVRWEVGEEI